MPNFFHSHVSFTTAVTVDALSLLSCQENPLKQMDSLRVIMVSKYVLTRNVTRGTHHILLAKKVIQEEEEISEVL